MAQQQRAVVVREIGKPAELTTRNVPSPKDNEVLLKVEASMILPHDAYGRDWGLFIENNLPFVLGSNTAGTVERLGSQVKGFAIGDKVFGLSDLEATDANQQGLQEYAVLSAQNIGKTPTGFSAEQVVSLPVNLVTSFVALFSHMYGFGWPAPWKEDSRIDASGRNLVVIGAGAMTGKFAIQLAKLAGVGRVVAIAGPHNEVELKKLGATHVVDRHGSVEEMTAQVHGIIGADEVTHVYDCRSMTFELAIALLSKTKESKLTTLHPNEQLELLAEQRPKCDAKFVENILAALGSDSEAFWKQVPRWLQNGDVVPGPFEIVEGLEKVNEINAALDGYSTGKGGPQTVVRP